MIELDLVRHYATYNGWMNGQVYEACEQIPDAKRREDLGAFFGSIHDTLVHIHVCDKMRMRQFDPGNVFWEQKPRGEDFSDWGELRADRVRCDEALVRWAAGLHEAGLLRTVRTACWVDERTHEYPLWVLLMHMYNHQTHHRGQVTALMWQLGVDFGVTGLAWQPGLLEDSLVPVP